MKDAEEGDGIGGSERRMAEGRERLMKDVTEQQGRGSICGT